MLFLAFGCWGSRGSAAGFAGCRFRFSGFDVVEGFKDAASNL